MIRYYINVYETGAQRLSDLVLNEENVPEGMTKRLHQLMRSERPEFVYDLIRENLMLYEGQVEAESGQAPLVLALEYKGGGAM
jgi:hypothetical protein